MHMLYLFMYDLQFELHPYSFQFPGLITALKFLWPTLRTECRCICTLTPSTQQSDHSGQQSCLDHTQVLRITLQTFPVRSTSDSLNYVGREPRRKIACLYDRNRLRTLIETDVYVHVGPTRCPNLNYYGFIEQSRSYFSQTSTGPSFTASSPLARLTVTGVAPPAKLSKPPRQRSRRST